MGSVFPPRLAAPEIDPLTCVSCVPDLRSRRIHRLFLQNYVFVPTACRTRESRSRSVGSTQFDRAVILTSLRERTDDIDRVRCVETTDLADRAPSRELEPPICPCRKRTHPQTPGDPNLNHGTFQCTTTLREHQSAKRFAVSFPHCWKNTDGQEEAQQGSRHESVGHGCFTILGLFGS